MIDISPDLTEVHRPARMAEFAYSLLKGIKPQVISIYSGNEVTEELDTLVRTSFSRTGIDIKGGDKFLQDGSNYLTVSIANNDHSIVGDRLSEDLPDVVYQVGKYTLQQCPLLSDGYYIQEKTDTGIGEVNQTFSQILEYFPNTSVGYITRFGTNNSLLDLPRNQRRIKVAHAIRASMGQVLDHPLLKDTHIFLFETTPTRAAAFRFALDRPLYKSNLKYNRNRFPLNSLLTNDYISTDEEAPNSVVNQLELLRAELSKFLEIKGINNHFSLEQNEQTKLFEEFCSQQGDLAQFAHLYLDEIGQDRVGLYYFVN